MRRISIPKAFIFKKVFFVFILSSIFLGNEALCLGESKTVNILTWWGYLNWPWISKEIKDACDVELSFDEYYSNTEFLRRWTEKRASYDIIIFSDTIFEAIKKDISSERSELYKNAIEYNRYVKAHYLKRNYPRNVAYFFHAITGFLWNPEILSLSSKDTISSIFKKATNNVVVLMDDPVEVNLLINRGLEKDAHGVGINNLKNLTQESIVYITNDYKEVYKKPNFAFSYTWSGEAVNRLVGIKNKHEFLVHPKLSYVSSDLLAVLNKKKSSICGSELLVSKKFLTKLQNDVFYFSPYGDTSKITDLQYRNVFLKYLSDLETLTWITPPPESELKKLDQAWKKTQLELTLHARSKSSRTQKIN